MSPQSIITELHRYFTAFDAIIEKYGLEKIKTIGDAYMAVSGLPEKNSNHAIQAIRAAKEIREFVQASINQGEGASGKVGEGIRGFQARIGIHSGPVVAGIVGSKKFVFDIWGDAVNTAARIEQNGYPQRISISGQTYELVKDHFSCEYRGKVKAKNKGELDMYFVN
jgi:class 3 adenylate cyclase